MESESASASLTLWIEQFLDHLANGRHLSPHSVKGYQRDLLHFHHYLNQREGDFLHLASQQIQDFVARRHRQGASSRTIQRNLSAIRSFYRFLLSHHMVSSNPALGISAPKGVQKLPSTLDVDQVAGLLSEGAEEEEGAIEVRDQAMFELFYSSGLRLSELVQADCGSIQLDEETIRVVGKGRKERIVPVGSKALRVMERWLRVRGALAAEGESALFVSQRGGRISPRTIQQRLAARAKERGVSQHVHPHLLRHSFASHILESSGNLRAVQEMLGHENISTTQIYTHLNFQHLAEVYDSTHPRARSKGGRNRFNPEPPVEPEEG